MTIATAEMIWAAVAIYLAIGFVMALAFAFGGAPRIDGAAKDAGLFFRLLIMPGTALLWPLILLMWIAGVGANKRDAA